MSEGQERKVEGNEEVQRDVVSDVFDEVIGGQKQRMVRSSSDVDIDVVKDGIANISVKEDVSVTQTDEDGGTTVVSKSIGRQFMGPTESMKSPAMFLTGGNLTIGEALQAASITAGHKPVDQTDAAAIKTAEARAAGEGGGGGGGTTVAGGIGAAAEAAAKSNERSASQGTKVTLSDVLAEVNEKLGSDKSVTREDAEAVVAAEVRDGPNNKTTPQGVAESMVAADRLNTNPSL